MRSSWRQEIAGEDLAGWKSVNDSEEFGLLRVVLVRGLALFDEVFDVGGANKLLDGRKVRRRRPGAREGLGHFMIVEAQDKRGSLWG